MANIEKALGEILDVLSHVVDTHTRWNLDMSHVDAVNKLAQARLHLVAKDEVVHEDAAQLLVDITKDFVKGGEK